MSAAVLQQGAPIRLTREAVRAKYGATRDPRWTPEIEDAFFASLPPPGYRERTPQTVERDRLVRDYGAATLAAQRMSSGYIATLGAILGLFAEADAQGAECLIARRDSSLGSERVVRTIQAQMLAAGLLVRETRPQGHGFVGEVFVYSPKPPFRHRTATVDQLERLHRDTEGEAPCPCLPSNLSEGDVPY